MLLIQEFLTSIFDYTYRNVFYFYWLPVFFTALGYLLLSIKHYHEDVAKRESYLANPGKVFYTPTLTVGTLVGRVIVCFLPFINILIAIVKFVPIIGRDIIDVCSKWLDIPLVPKPAKKVAET